MAERDFRLRASEARSDALGGRAIRASARADAGH